MSNVRTRFVPYDPTHRRAPNIDDGVWNAHREYITILAKCGKSQRYILAHLKKQGELDSIPSTTTINQLGSKMREWDIDAAEITYLAMSSSSSGRTGSESLRRQFEETTGFPSSLSITGLSIWSADIDSSVDIDSWSFKRAKSKQFFCSGRVFAVSRQQGSKASSCVFVVAKRMGSIVICAAIRTYRGAGLSKEGLEANAIDAHAIIGMTGANATYLPDEPKSKLVPLTITPTSAVKRLHPASRLNLAQALEIKCNEDIGDVGILHESSLPIFMRYFRQHTHQG